MTERPTMDALVEKYVRVRDRKKQIVEQQKEDLRPYDDALSQLETRIMHLLNQMEVESVKTKHGTAYKQGWTTARVADWQQVLDYAVENERFDLFERRVNKTIVTEIGHVPGVEIDTGVRINIRRS